MKYYGVALSIATLEKLREKETLSKQDIALLKSTLKYSIIPAEARENDPQALVTRGEEEKSISKAFNKISLKADAKDVLFETSKVVAEHYVNRDNLHLTYEQKDVAQEAIQSATDVNDIIKALERAFSDAITGVLEKDRFLQPLEDLAASWQQQ